MTVIRRLVRLGLAVSNPQMMMNAAYYCHVSVVRYLVKGLGAEVNRSHGSG